MKSQAKTDPIKKNPLTEGLRDVTIEFMYLDLSVCTRCQDTHTHLEEALSDVTQILNETGVGVRVEKIHVTSEKQARKQGFVTSPTIRVNGQDIQMDFKESLCESCGPIGGGSCVCRVWTYRGEEYNAAPKGMIIEAVLREVYGPLRQKQVRSMQLRALPENLKSFFKAREGRQTLRCSDSTQSAGSARCC